MSISIKRTNYGDVPFSSSYYLNLVEKTWPITSAFCFFLLFFNFKNLLTSQYLVKSEIKGLIETKLSFMGFFPVQAAMLCILKKKQYGFR